MVVTKVMGRSERAKSVMKQLKRPQKPYMGRQEWLEYKGRKYSVIDLGRAYDWAKPYTIEVADITDGVDVFDERYTSFEEAYTAIEDKTNER